MIIFATQTEFKERYLIKSKFIRAAVTLSTEAEKYFVRRIETKVINFISQSLFNNYKLHHQVGKGMTYDEHQNFPFYFQTTKISI